MTELNAQDLRTVADHLDVLAEVDVRTRLALCGTNGGSRFELVGPNGGTIICVRRDLDAEPDSAGYQPGEYVMITED